MRRADGRLPLPVGLLAGIVLLLGSVFLGTYSKDAPVLLVSAALVVLGRSLRAELLILALVIAYAGLFRTYWLLILVGFLCLRLLWRSWPRRIAWIVGPILLTIVFAVAVVVFLHQPADYFRSSVNVARTGDVDSRTMMHGFTALPEPLGGTTNVLLTFFTLFLPVPLLGFATSYYIAVFALFVVLWAVFWWKLLRAAPQRNDPSGRFRAAAFLLALVSVQALFEPDYGSVLRHLTPLLPVLLLVSGDVVRLRRQKVAPARRAPAERRSRAA
jgi:hypothetical protein